MATINYNSGNINVSFFPSNVNPIWFCDKNTGGVNIATNGATIIPNTLQLGNSNSNLILGNTVNIVNNEYYDTGSGPWSITGGYNVTSQAGPNYVYPAYEYSIAIWGGTNDWGYMALGFSFTFKANVTYRITLRYRTNYANGMGVNLEIPAGVSKYSFPRATTTYQTAVYTFTHGSTDTGNNRFGVSADSTAVSGKTFYWNIFKIESLGSSYRNVGIGTMTPSYPLHVEGVVNRVSSGGSSVGYYFAATNSITSSHSFSSDVSIYTPFYVWSGIGFVASSDRRIKTNIVDIQDDAVLKLFRRIQPKSYEYVDKFKKGTETVYGFIAQEVRDVLPIATSLVTETLPNIYTLVPVNGNLLAIDTMKLEYDASGQLLRKLKLIKEDNSEYFVHILSVEGNAVQIDQTLEGDKVFVYGQEVNNFHTLNKDAIWTVAAAALQEVDRQVQRLDEQLQAEKEKTKTLEQNYEQLLQRILALESKGSAP